MSEPSIEKLINAARSGDRLALSQLLYLHHRPLTRYLGQHGKSLVKYHVGVEDIVQATYFCAFRDIQQCKAYDSRAFMAWLRVIGIHQLQNTLKAARAVKRGGGLVRIVPAGQHSSRSNPVAQLIDHGERPSEIAARRQAAAALNDCLENLPDDHRRAIKLRFLEGHTENEVASKMGQSRDAVHGLIVRARVMMRDWLGSSSRWFYRK